MMVIVDPVAPVQVAIAGSELVKITGFPDTPPEAEIEYGASPNVLASSAANTNV